MKLLTPLPMVSATGRRTSASRECSECRPLWSARWRCSGWYRAPSRRGRCSQGRRDLPGELRGGHQARLGDVIAEVAVPFTIEISPDVAWSEYHSR